MVLVMAGYVDMVKFKAFSERSKKTITIMTTVRYRAE